MNLYIGKRHKQALNLAGGDLQEIGGQDKGLFNQNNVNIR